MDRLYGRKGFSVSVNCVVVCGVECRTGVPEESLQLHLYF